MGVGGSDCFWLWRKEDAGWVTEGLRIKCVDLGAVHPSPSQITGRTHFGFGFPNPVGVPKPWASYDSSQARSKVKGTQGQHPSSTFRRAVDEVDRAKALRVARRDKTVGRCPTTRWTLTVQTPRQGQRRKGSAHKTSHDKAV